VPVGFTLSLALGGKTAAAATAATSAGWSAKVISALTKPAVAVAAGATLVAGGAYVVTQTPDKPPPRAAAPTAASTARPPSRSPSTTPSPSPTKTKTKAKKAKAKTQLYGTVVDAVDSAPSATALPAALPHRAENGITATGAPATGMTHRGENVTLSGQGYFRVLWQILPGERPGAVVMPTWTGLRGKLFHVASGGGHRMDDVQPGATDGTTWMGGPSTGMSVLPSGTQQMWQDEYFWIDGTVTLHQNERGADYNLFVETSTWDKVTEDVRTGPAQGAVRYGLVRDNGKDTAPVPQYLTRSAPTDPATVPQQSRVTSRVTP
jgi:hypothetical protein